MLFISQHWNQIWIFWIQKLKTKQTKNTKESLEIEYNQCLPYEPFLFNDLRGFTNK